MDKNEYFEVKSSGIHRHGVFAIVDIPKGTRLSEYKGRKITKKEGDQILDGTIEKYKNDPENNAATYIFELDETWDIDGDIEDNDAKYINHSCEPNCEFDVAKSEGKIWVNTIKDIKKGEEITYNYGFELCEKEPYDFMDHECRCGSSRCVGYILDEDQWPKMKELLKAREQKEEIVVVSTKIL